MLRFLFAGFLATGFGAGGFGAGGFLTAVFRVGSTIPVVLVSITSLVNALNSSDSELESPEPVDELPELEEEELGGFGGAGILAKRDCLALRVERCVIGTGLAFGGAPLGSGLFPPAPLRGMVRCGALRVR